VLGFRNAAAFGEVKDQVVLRAQEEARLLLRIDQGHGPMEDGDRLVDLPREIVHGRELDQRPAGPVEVARGPEQLLRPPEEGRGIGEPALSAAERALQVQKDGLFTGILCPAPEVVIGRSERLLGTVEVGTHPSRVGEMPPGPSAQILETLRAVDVGIELIGEEQSQASQSLRLLGILRRRRQAPLDQKFQDGPGPKARIGNHQANPGPDRPPEKLDEQLRSLGALLRKSGGEAERQMIARQRRRRRDRVGARDARGPVWRTALEPLPAPLAIAQVEKDRACLVALIQKKCFQA
jgi:hypothetical protein